MSCGWTQKHDETRVRSFGLKAKFDEASAELPPGWARKISHTTGKVFYVNATQPDSETCLGGGWSSCSSVLRQSWGKHSGLYQCETRMFFGSTNQRVTVVKGRHIEDIWCCFEL